MEQMKNNDVQEPEVITIDGVEYPVADFDNEQLYMVNQLKSLKQKMTLVAMDLDQLKAAEIQYSSALINSVTAPTEDATV
jgi:hypothetical protein